MNFTIADGLFAQFYQLAEGFLRTCVDTMHWLFLEPFIPLQTWYWNAYSAISGSPFEEFLSPIYRYFAWASGAPTITGDEISFGAFLLTGGVSIWVFIRVLIFVFDLVVKLVTLVKDWVTIRP